MLDLSTQDPADLAAAPPTAEAEALSAAGKDVLLDDRELGADATAFTDIRILRQPVLRADYVGPQTHSLPARAAVRPGRFCLQPIEQRQTELLGPIQVLRGFLSAYLAKIAQHVVVLRPVHQRDVALIRALDELRLVGDAAIGPKAGALFRIGLQLGGLAGDGVAIRPR